MPQADIQTQLAHDFPDAQHIVVRLDDAYALIEVIDAGFAALSQVQRQQRVYKSITAWIADKSIHAVTIHTGVPDEA